MSSIIRKLDCAKLIIIKINIKNHECKYDIPSTVPVAGIYPIPLKIDVCLAITDYNVFLLLRVLIFDLVYFLCITIIT